MTKKLFSVDMEAFSPVQLIDTGSKHKYPEKGIALCLSGGGYRAMLFHLGSLWRLNEFGYLKKLSRISSVSGGSITAVVLGCNWSKLGFDNSGKGINFVKEVVEPIRKLASKTIDVGAVLSGALGPGSIAERVQKAYEKFLFEDATLQDLPDEPRFVINTSNVQSGVLWRFMKPYMADYRVGIVKKPTIKLAVAVAASSACPPFLSPVKLELNTSDFEPNSGRDLQYEPFTTDIVLTDGGVYDNLGLETAWKRYDTILVSDAGGQMQPQAEPKLDWARHTFRVRMITDNQVRALRKRQLIESYKLRKYILQQGVNQDNELFELITRDGAYWGIRSDITHYELVDALACPFDQTTEIASIQTRLKRLDNSTQERLINWGYAVCDAAMRKHVDTTLPVPAAFPYEIGVG